jgi:hypothetical protein
LPPIQWRATIAAANNVFRTLPQLLTGHWWLVTLKKLPGMEPAVPIHHSTNPAMANGCFFYS